MGSVSVSSENANSFIPEELFVQFPSAVCFSSCGQESFCVTLLSTSYPIYALQNDASLGKDDLTDMT